MISYNKNRCRIQKAARHSVHEPYTTQLLIFEYSNVSESLRPGSQWSTKAVDNKTETEAAWFTTV
jgi:hypothetical protein